LVAKPSSRDVHSKPVPRLGGISIYISTMLGVAAFYITAYRMNAVPRDEKEVLQLLGPATVIFLFGLADDRWGMSAWMKLGGQVTAASLLWISGFHVAQLPVLFGSREFAYFIAAPLTIAWIVWITNAFNLIDGLDGLSAGSALFSTVAMMIISIFNHNYAVAALCAVLAGAILGFLKYNFNPASIFLGDCGSLFIGFLLGALALAGAQQKTPTLVAVAIPVICFGLPVMETMISIIRRFLSGKPIFTADREHLHHKLMERGLSHRQVVVVLYGVSVSFALVSLVMLYPRRIILAVALVSVFLLIGTMLYYLGYHEFVELRRVATRAMEQRQVMMNNIAIRRAQSRLHTAASWNDLKDILDGAFREGDFDGYSLNLVRQTTDDLPYKTLCSWNRLPHDSGSAAWRLRIELRDHADRCFGALNLSRNRCDSDVLVDINVLTGEFLAALTTCVSRLARETHEVSHDESAEAQTMGAVAGDD